MNWDANYKSLCADYGIDPCPPADWRHRLVLGQLFPWTRRRIRKEVAELRATSLAPQPN
jgi:hypothetical protein